MTRKQLIDKTVAVLKNGKTILYPTDTIWGLGCDPFNESAVNSIFYTKKREKEKGFILLVDSIGMLKEYIEDIPVLIEAMIDIPSSPLTAVYHKTQKLPDFLLSEDGSIAIRIVQHDLIREIIHQFGKPIVSTSANTSGHAPPEDYDSLESDIKTAVDLIIPPEHDNSTLKVASKMVDVQADGKLFWIR